LFVGCDGGLMHVAHTTETPSVTLFAHLESPHLRLTNRCRSLSIQSQGAVRDIAPDRIAGAIVERLSAVGAHGAADA
jgi:heptosyltransferase-2